MAEVDDSDGSDEWGMEELDIKDCNVPQNNSEIEAKDDDEDYWNIDIQKEEPVQEDLPKKAERPSEPMIIVDLTMIDPNIHSKYDRNSVNDAQAASALRKSIELDYPKYSKDALRISDGTILPCASTVWRDALMRLRDERPGHYFVPIFPPKMKS